MAWERRNKSTYYDHRPVYSTHTQDLVAKSAEVHNISNKAVRQYST